MADLFPPEVIQFWWDIVLGLRALAWPCSPFGVIFFEELPHG